MVLQTSDMMDVYLATAMHAQRLLLWINLYIKLSWDGVPMMSQLMMDRFRKRFTHLTNWRLPRFNGASDVNTVRGNGTWTIQRASNSVERINIRRQSPVAH